jgi:TonB family protein
MRRIFLGLVLAMSVVSVSAAEQPPPTSNTPSDEVQPPAPATLPIGNPETNRIRRDDYPVDMVRWGIGGRVVLRVQVDEAGNVTGATVVQSSGQQQLDDAAVRVVRERFRYSPARDASGKPVPAVIRTTMVWAVN